VSAVANPSGSRGDAAYDRALGAYHEHAYDVARRWVLEALAQDPQHAGARALLGRLNAGHKPASPLETTPSGIVLTHGSQGRAPGKGPEVISTDPTVLISRASGPVMPEAIEPTLMIQRDDPRLRLPKADTRAAAPPPKHTAARPVAEPTIISHPSPRPAPSGPGSSHSAGSAVQSLWQRLRPRGSRSPSPRRQSPAGRVGTTPDRRPGMWTPGLRGALIAVATVAAASLFVWGAILAGRWLWPAGQPLTLTRPVGGTIAGPGLNCGTHGTDCSTTRPTGEAVALEAQADDRYVFSGWFGDCAPTGRMSMSEPRKCGATFDPVTAPPQAVTFRLTITKPTGGTVVGAGDILCGTLGSNCSADVPSGAPVTLHFEADSGYTFSQFTGDCAANGEMAMTTAKTCSATFTPTSTPVANVLPSGPAGPPRPRRQKEATEVTPPPPTPPPAASLSPPVGAPGAESTPTNPDKPAAPPITAEQHAKNEIEQLVKNYCAEYDTLKPDRIQKLFPLVNQGVLRDQFRQYKSLTCTLTAPLEYERLDARPAGGAQVKFGMKQVIQMRSGGAPKTVETIVTMVVSRTDLQSAWLIDRVRHDPKPKP
jgi:hypothetical protein